MSNHSSAEGSRLSDAENRRSFEMELRSPTTGAAARPGTSDKKTPAVLSATADREPAGIAAHFSAMVIKNVQQKVRTPISCCLEFLLPPLFLLCLVGIASISDNDTFPDTQVLKVNDSSGLTPADTNDIRHLLCIPPSNLSLAPAGFIRPCVDDSEMADCMSKHTPFTLCAPYKPWFSMLSDYLRKERLQYIATLDEAILHMWIGREKTPEVLSEQSNSRWAAIANGGVVHFAPRGPEVDAMISYFNQSTQLFRYVVGTTFASKRDLEDAMKRDDMGGKAWAAIEVDRLDSTDLDVAIRQNRTGVPTTSQIRSNFFQHGLGSYRTMQYEASGFLAIEQAIAVYYKTQILGLPAEPIPTFIPMPYRGYTDKVFLRLAGVLAPLVLVFSFLFPVSQLTKRIVEEKEARLREAMMIMGLSAASFYNSWIFTYAIQFIGTALLMATIGKLWLLELTDWFLMFLLFFGFGMTTITLSGLKASLMSKSRVAAIVSPILFFMLSIPSFALPENTPIGIRIFISVFLSPSTFSMGLTLLFEKEQNAGFPLSDITNTKDQPPMFVIFILLLWNFVFYLLLTLYFDAVTPSEWGTRRHPLFCIVEPYRWYQRRQAKQEAQAAAVSDGRDQAGSYEIVTHDKEPQVRLKGLRKEFELDDGSIFTAVNDLTLDFYEGEITMLLGHNGAGKTTAINVMTGMLEPTAGDCTIYGSSVTTELSAVRQEVGLCPQHNILWPELTCRQHLAFYARLKGVVGSEQDEAIEAILTDLGLLNKIDQPAGSLSGGMKRKLSVAIAFIGGSRCVFLDEPTAGMDVAARRLTWDLIRKYSEGRTIIITTHFMDEADLLGNSVAIMSKGRLKCQGSPMFLKSRLGVGYTLAIACSHATPIDAVVDCVHEFVPDAATLSRTGGELSMQLPMASVPQFPPLLRRLEEDTFALRSYGMSLTTLEEVFLKIGHDDEMAAAAAAQQQQQHLAPPTAMPPAVPARHQGRQRLGSPEHDGAPLWADREMVAGPPDNNAAAHHPDNNNNGENDDEPLWTADEVADSDASILGQMLPLVKKRFYYQRRDTRAVMLQIVIPIVSLVLAMLIGLISFPAAPRLSMNSGVYGGTDATIANCPADLADFVTPDTELTVVDVPLPYAYNLSQRLLDTALSHSKERLYSFVCHDSTVTPTPTAVLFVNESFAHASAVAVNEYHWMTARRGTNSKSLSMKFANYPFPLSDREQAQMDSASTLIVGIFILIPFTLIPSTFVSFVVKEREVRAKDLQTTSGMHFFSYWVSNYVFDFASFIVTTILAILVFLIFSRDEYIGDSRVFGATFVLFMCYGLAGVSGSYLVSFAFDEHGTAQNIVMLANFICGFLLVLLAYFLSIIDSTKDAGEKIKFLFRVVPAYCLGDGIIQLASIPLLQAFADKKVDPFDMDVTGWNILYLAVSCPLYFGFTLGLDHPARRQAQERVAHESGEAEAIPDEDEDVAAERFEVESGMREGDVVLVKNLRKVYSGGKVAVRNLSFGVHRGEVFGFLGTNGAGKTTTMSIMSGEAFPNRGSAVIDKVDVVKEGTSAVRHLIGYCPQFDALHELLTPEEHLYLYAGIRGIRHDVRERVVERLMRRCDLIDHRHKVAGSLSGGNKRKLSVAISLLGGPSVVFLDEPSAGMDPMARRVMWGVIEKVAKKSSVVLTTHHLEEVEVLADRVAIMDAGQIKCIGALQALKGKFGTGFEMSIRVASEAAVPALRDYIAPALPGSALQEDRNAKLTYSLPPSTKLSRVFELIEEAKERLAITDYGISQTSLESVFLKVAEEEHSKEKEDEEEDGEAPTRPDEVV